MNYVGERPADPLTVVVFPADGEGAFALYEDAGDGHGHEQGAAARTRLACEGARETVTVRLGPTEGGFVPSRRRVELEVRGLGRAPRALWVDGRRMEDWYQDGTLLRLSLPARREQTVVELRR
jgi:alpha-glucosidase